MRVLTCQSCNQDKNELKKVKSELLDNYYNTLCLTCSENKFEPRFIVILAVNKLGVQNVKIKKFFQTRRYHGADITLEELV